MCDIALCGAASQVSYQCLRFDGCTGVMPPAQAMVAFAFGLDIAASSL